MVIKGITVYLSDKTLAGYDNFKNPIYKETEIPIDNVLVSPTSTNDVLNQLNLTGKKVTYTLAIPKGDAHDWENKKVRFFDKEWRTVGMSIQGIDELIPLAWNKKVMVERYE